VGWCRTTPAHCRRRRPLGSGPPVDAGNASRPQVLMSAGRRSAPQSSPYNPSIDRKSINPHTRVSPSSPRCLHTGRGLPASPPGRPPASPVCPRGGSARRLSRAASCGPATGVEPGTGRRPSPSQLRGRLVRGRRRDPATPSLPGGGSLELAAPPAHQPGPFCQGPAPTSTASVSGRTRLPSWPHFLSSRGSGSEEGWLPPAQALVLCRPWPLAIRGQALRCSQKRLSKALDNIAAVK
jgi:hypothetical protein